MKSFDVLLSRCAFATGIALCLSGVFAHATEVASSANLFPSPTGIYKTSSPPTSFAGVSVQCLCSHLRMASSSVPPPAAGPPVPVTFQCVLDVGVSSASPDGGTTFSWATYPASVTLSISADATGGPGSYNTEMLSLSVDGLPGGMMLRESPTLASTGRHTVRMVPSGTFFVSSFFDVFTELSLDGGASWIPGSAPTHLDLDESLEMVAATGDVPPAGAVTSCRADIFFASHAVVVRDLALKTSSPITMLPLQGQLFQGTETGKASGQLSLDGGTTFAPFECDYTGKRKFSAFRDIPTGEVCDDEFISFLLSGGSLPSNVCIRESPSKASLGRTSIRMAKDGLYRIGSFFDVFTEVSLTSGATWLPAEGQPSLFQFNPKEISLDAVAFPSAHLLPPMGVYVTGNAADVFEFTDGTMTRGLHILLPSSSLSPPAQGAQQQVQTVACTVQFDVSTNGGVSYDSQRLPATATVRISPGSGGGGAGGSTSASTFDTELLQLDAGGSTAPVMLRESPTKQSLGKTSITSASDGTKLISSFFDIFTELSLDGGATWALSPRTAYCFALKVSDEVVQTPSLYLNKMDLLDCFDAPAMVFPNGAVLQHVSIHPNQSGSDLPATGTTNVIALNATASGELSLDNGRTFTSWTGACTGSFKVTSYLDTTTTRYFDTEMLALSLSGGSLGPVMIRESPTKQSLGRTSLRTTPSTSFGTCSFFDVFTEISLDAGATWTPASGAPTTFGLHQRHENFFSSTALPLPGDYVSDAPLLLPNNVILYRLRKRPEILYQAWDDAISDLIVAFDGTIEGEISTDGGATMSPFRTPYTSSVRVSPSSGGDRPMESVSLNFTITKGGQTYMIRESPTLQSTGQTTVRPAGGGYMIDSFFDVFTELSVDGGIVWSPGSNRLHMYLLPYIEQDNGFRSNFFPPRDGSFDAQALSDPVTFPGTVSSVITNMRVRLDQLEARSQPLPSSAAPQTQTTSCVVECDLSLDGGVTWTTVSAPADLSLQAQLRNGTTDTFDTEMLALNISGGSLPAGVMIRESPTLPSTGRTAVTSRLMEEEGIYYYFDSFFDVFTEISLDNGTSWVPAGGACRLYMHHSRPGTFNSSNWQPVVALHRAADPAFELQFEDTDVSISGVTFDRAMTTDILPNGTTPLPGAGEQAKRACLFNLGLKGRMASGSGGGAPVESWNGEAYITWEFSDVLVGSPQTSMTTEVTDLFFSGGTLPAGMMLRESPTKQSLGKTSLRTTSGGYRISSFFDVFLELSLDGGQTWHAATAPLHMETIDASPDHPVDSLSLEPPQNVIVRTSELSSRSASGKRVSSVQFASLIDSSLNFIDDRHLLGLRTYDAILQYALGDSVVYNNYQAQVSMTIDAVKTSDDLDTSRLDASLEITSFDVKGGTLPAAVRLRESPTLPSKGYSVTVAQADGSYRRSSFFDVFTEISVDNGTTWEPLDQPLRCELADRAVSVQDHSDFYSPKVTLVQRDRPVRCADGTCRAMAITFTTAPSPLPTLLGGKQVYQLQGVSSCVFAPAGAAESAATCPLTAQVMLTYTGTTGGTRYFDTEMLSLSLSGGTLPGGAMLRESPSKASLGKHSVTDAGGGQYRISSFFDIFTEISLDGGQTWSESDGTTRLELAAPGIVVQSPAGTDLIDGLASVDFGDVGINNGVAMRTFTVTNSGTATTGTLATTLTGADGAMFKVVVPPVSPVAPNGSTAFTVQVTPTSIGGKSAMLHILSNDLSKPSFDIALTANGIAAAPPAATTLGAGGLTFNGATVNGTANANASTRAVFFDYGPTTSYGSSIAATPSTVTGTTLTNVSATLAALLPHTFYHYRVRVTSAQGGANGADKTFATLDRAPVANPETVLALPSAKVTIHVLSNDTDADGDALGVFSFTQPGAPAGTVMKVGTDLVFTPSATFSGGSFTYIASDAFGGRSAPATVTLTLGTCVIGPNATFASDSPPYDVTVTANAPWTIVGAPSWLAFTPPAPGDTKAHFIPAPFALAGTRSATFKIGGQPHTATQNRAIAAPVLTVPNPVPNAAISSSYDLAIPTQYGPVTYITTGLPPGLTLSDTTGHITGSPTASSNPYHVTITAKNVKGPSNPITFDITVLAFPPALVGNYSATIEDAALTSQFGGLMTMGVTGTGTVTGTLKLGTGSHPFTGRLNTAVDPLNPDPAHARLTTTVTRAGKPSVVLTVNMNNTATDLIAGDVSLPVAPPSTATLNGSKHVWNATTKPASDYAGYFTTALQPAMPLTATIPQGDGFLTFTITAAGAVTWSGQLADGAVIPATSATLWSNGDLPLFVLLYSSKGSLNQKLSIAPVTKVVSGAPRWLKQSQLSAVRAYAAGFATTLQGAGAEYVAPGAGKTLLNLTAPATAHIAFADGGIESVAQFSDLDQGFTVSATHVATFSPDPAVNPTSMKLTSLDVTKGLFVGTMGLKDSNPFNAALPKVVRTVTFNGVLLPASSAGTGWFLLPAISSPPANVTTSPETSGQVSISP